MPLSAGSRLGSYEILGPLGAGGMGEVYRARDPKLGRDVAIKVLPENVALDPERLARFEREARSLAALNHPGIVTIFAVEEAEGARFLAMELVEGDGLDTLVPPGGLPLSRFLEIAVPLAEALSAAHERGIVHRDLKPGNVMVTRDGRVKVLDFGLARVEAPDSNPNLTSTPTESRITDLTGEGQVFGTVAYMSPEQARGAKVDARSDVFSLGVVMYQMLTGEHPFHGATAVDLISSILRDRPPSVIDLRADVPPDLARVVRRCLEKEPRDRYQTSRDVYNELKELRAAAASTPPAPPPRSGAHADARPPSGPVPSDEGFWVAVLPFQHRGDLRELADLAEGITDEIVTGLSRFSYLRVISRSSTRRFTSDTADVRTVGKELGARYVLDGSLRQAGSALRISVQLVDAVSGAHLWAETYNRTLRPEAMFELQDDVVPRIVSTVADTHGILPHSMSEGLRGRSPKTLTPYEAVLCGLAQVMSVSAENHASVRAGLERAVQEAPANADAWALLSNMYREEYAHGFNVGPDPLGRALAAAQRAVEIAPSNHLAHHALATALFLRREFPAFRGAAERAVALNPMDGFTMAYLASLFAYSGDWERGCAMAKRARDLNPNHPGWYWFSDCFDAYRHGDYQTARDIARKIQMPGFWRLNLALAAAHGQLGEHDAAAAALRDLLAARPVFASHPREELAKWWNPDFVDALMDGLHKAGLEIRAEDSVQRGPSSAPVSGATRDDEGFWIAVLPFQHRGASPEFADLAEGMTDEVVAGLSRFSYLRVISRSSTQRLSGEAADARAVGRSLGARYVLEGSLRRAGTMLRVSAQLVDASSGVQLWSETYDQDFRPEAAFEIQDALVPRIVSTVADMHGVLPRSISDALRHRPPESLSPQEAVLRSFGYWERVTPEDLAASRSALEHAVRKEPANADAWAMLGLLGVQDYAQGFGLQPNALENGFDAARCAVDLAPTSPLAHFALAQALFFRKELDKFRHEAERTVSLNPMDGSSLALVGEMLGHAGEWDRALALTRRARELNPHHPGWYWYVDFYDAYRRHDYRSAREVALKIGTTNHWGAHLLMAAACAKLGDREAAAQAVREAVRLRPSVAETFAEDARKWFEPGFAAQVIDGLRKAGLDVRRRAGEAAAAPAPGVSAAAPEPKRRWWMVAAAAVAVVLAVLWIGRSRSGTARAPETSAAPQAILSLAVLPLDNYSGDPSQDYFAEGMTDELTSQLANISGLRVISRGSAMQFKGKNRPPTPEIAKKLDVDAVVEGSVIRSGDRVRITAQLIDARSDRHLWAKSFERSSKDVLALQDELASAIANEIHVKLTPAEESRRAKGRSVDPKAYDAYLKGRYFFNRPSDENLTKAIAQFEEATRLDPTFAPAFSGLSDAYLWAAFNEGVLTAAEAKPRAKESAERAIQLDDGSAEGHTSLATYKSWFEYDWFGSETEYRRALKLNPNYAFAHDQFGLSLALQGRLDEAIAEGKRATELDPLSPQIPIDNVMAFAFRHDYAAAKAEAARAATLDPTFFFAPFMQGWIELQAGNAREAIPGFEKARALESPPFVAAWLGYAYGAAGDRERARAMMEQVNKASLRGYVPPFNLAIIHLGLGDREKALDYLEKAYAADSQWLIYLGRDRIFDPLRSEPRFRALMKKLNFER